MGQALEQASEVQTEKRSAMQSAKALAIGWGSEWELMSVCWRDFRTELLLALLSELLLVSQLEMPKAFQMVF
jgi:hypothetical protein